MDSTIRHPSAVDQAVLGQGQVPVDGRTTISLRSDEEIISRETLLAYPNFDEEFHIHTDASHTQLGAVISQNKRPIAFYSRKLSNAQTCYTTNEWELLAIVETLKEFRNILLGQHILQIT